MDFGISASTSENTAGVVAGTLEYMAPEQATGKPVDARADVYAFGLILYEMLAGPRPSAATGDERIAAMWQRLEAGLPPLGTVDETVPEPLANVVTRCLERDPEQRYATGAELCAALGALDDAGELIPEPRRLTRRQVAAAVTAMVAMLAATYYFARPTPQVEHEPVPVLIADFENRSGDPVFDATVEQSLGLALEQASYITVFRTRDARAIARRLSPDKSDRITGEIGQLIARREGLKVLVAGAIDKRGNGYRLELTATDPATGKPIATAGRNVSDTNQVLEAIDLMAKDVRGALGESKTEMAKVAAAETVTAGSLQAIRAYARAQDLSRANKIPEALEAYQEAVTLDPQFGRAYAGMGSIYSNYYKQPEKAEANYQLAMKHLDRMTDREKYRTLGTYYLNVVRNYEKAVETYETLVRLFPADEVGHGNLALAYLQLGNLSRAVEEVRRSLAIYPRNSLQRYNYVMYLMYAGDFPTAVAEATKLLEENPAFEVPLLPMALSRIAQGDVKGGIDAYAKLEASGAQGASVASLGRADLEMYLGRHRAAVALLRSGIAADRKADNLAAVAHKDVALAEAYLALGDTARAAAAADEALKLSHRESTMFPAAVVLLLSGRNEAAADATARDLDNMLQRQTTAYARLIRGQIAAKRGQFAEAVEAFRDAQKRHDSWFGRYLLGKLYVETNHFAEAIAELELSVKRRGETTDVFFYDMPTLRYLPTAYYWLARAQEGLGGKAEAQKNYELFLSLRQEADPADPLAVDARRRVTKP
jgi:tetratricopeptide (TPR) repeat protein